MTFEYFWKNSEANFGPPIQKEVDGGTHITFEIILKKGKDYIALRRPKGIEGHVMTPKEKFSEKGMLYFCHDLISYGESVEHCVKRVVKSQTGVSVTGFKTVYLESFVKGGEWGIKTKQWAIIPHIITKINKIPIPGNYKNPVVEVVKFTKDSIPDDFAWWSKKDLKEFLEKYD